MNNFLKPNLFIVGAPKCGTTSLFYYLSQHPAIGISSIKEPMYFATDLTENTLSREDYEELFPLKSDNKYYLEASTWYLYSKKAPKKINCYNSSSKIIIILRKPLNLLTSLFDYRRFTGRENVGSLSEAILLEDDRLIGASLPKNTDLHPLQYHYSGLVKFSKGIKNYRRFFHEDQILILNYDQLQKNRYKLLCRIFDFLDLNHIPLNELKLKAKNVGRANRSRLLKRIINHPPLFVRKIANFFFPTKVRTWIYRTLVSLNSKEKNKSINDIVGNKKVNKMIQEITKNEMYFLIKTVSKSFNSWK